MSRLRTVGGGDVLSDAEVVDDSLQDKKQPNEQEVYEANQRQVLLLMIDIT